MSAFSLHPQLEADTEWVCDLALSRCLLMRDSRFPWLILVPRAADLRELHDVPAVQQATLWNEINRASAALTRVAKPYKLNVAALGNQVPQLHIHVIARQQTDPAWPNPVWGSGSAEPYTDANLSQLIEQLRSELTT